MFEMGIHDVLAEPEKLLRITGGAGIPDQQLTLGIEKQEHGGSPHTIMRQREFRLRDFNPIKTGDQRIAVRVQPNQPEMLSKIILNF